MKKLYAGLNISTEKSITINLNNHSITSNEDITIVVSKGEVRFTGQGNIQNTKQKSQGGTMYVKGSINEGDTNYTHLIIDENVSVEGPNPLVVDSYNAENHHCYGAVVDIYGKLTNNLSGYSSPTVITVDYKLKDIKNAPIINIHDGASIKNNINTGGVGILLSGYAHINADKATIEAHTGIYASSGSINLKGTTVKATGQVDYKTENQEKFGKGTGATGAAIQVESKSTSAGNIEINIDGGNYTSEYNSAIVEYSNGATQTSVNKINISKGNFTSADGKDVIDVTENFKQENPKFITGGNFLSGDKKSDVSEFVKSGYREDEKGNVVKKPTSPSPSTHEDSGNIKPEENKNGENNEDKEIIAPEANSTDNIQNPNTKDNLYLYLTSFVVSINGLRLLLKQLI